MAEEKDFELGFVFAGAVSAGAYSAGVIDFIVEALDAYEHCRTHGRTPEGEAWDGPTHAVRVPVMWAAQIRTMLQHSPDGGRKVLPTARNRPATDRVAPCLQEPSYGMSCFHVVRRNV